MEVKHLKNMLTVINILGGQRSFVSFEEKWAFLNSTKRNKLFQLKMKILHSLEKKEG